MVLVDLFKNEGSYLNRVEFSPYVFGGLAVFHHNRKGLVPESYNGPEAGTWVPLQPLGTEGQYSVLAESDVNFGIKPYSRIQFAIPVGIGMRVRLGQALDVSFEMGYRQTLFDYLDDVSQNYVDLGVLNSELALVMSDRTREPVAVASGEQRFDLSDGESNFAESMYNSTYSYTRRGGGGVTLTTAGFGQEHQNSLRGSKNDWDIYTITSIKIAYIVGGSFRKAKFR